MTRRRGGEPGAWTAGYGFIDGPDSPISSGEEWSLPSTVEWAGELRPTELGPQNFPALSRRPGPAQPSFVRGPTRRGYTRAPPKFSQGLRAFSLSRAKHRRHRRRTRGSPLASLPGWGTTAIGAGVDPRRRRPPPLLHAAPSKKPRGKPTSSER